MPISDVLFVKFRGNAKNGDLPNKVQQNKHFMKQKERPRSPNNPSKQSNKSNFSNVIIKFQQKF